MIVVILFFLFLSIYLYAVLGGADFGIGILELYSSPNNRLKTKAGAYRVIGPVWEANHIWLIIVMVILWVAFPAFFHQLMLNLHLPLTLALLGIIVRGVAFVFRHYDAVQDNSQKIYDRMFEWSSLFTPVILGTVFGSIIGGYLFEPDLERDNFFSIYLAPWLNLSSITMGLFFAGLCSFNSSIFMIGESNFEQKLRYSRKAQYANILMAIAGLGTIGFGLLENNRFSSALIDNWLGSLTIMANIAFLQLLLWNNLGKGRKITVRILAGLMSLLILALPISAIGAYELLNLTDSNMTSPKTLQVLGWSLIAGGILIIPGLIHLLKTFGMLKVFNEH